MQFCRIYARHVLASPVLPPPSSRRIVTGTRGTLPMRTHKLLCPSSWNYASIHHVTRIVLMTHHSRNLPRACTNVKYFRKGICHDIDDELSSQILGQRKFNFHPYFWLLSEFHSINSISRIERNTREKL